MRFVTTAGVVAGAVLLLAVVCHPQEAAAPAKPKPTPLKPYPLSAEERQRLEARTAELSRAVAALKAADLNRDFVADVEVYHKAGQWLLEFPEDIFSQEEFQTALSVLDEGLERARQLRAGQAPWMQRPGRRIHGFYSRLDGSVQLYQVRVPASYDGTRPVRLYVWLHGRDQRNTEANFISRSWKSAASHSDAADVGQIQLDVYGRWNGMAYHYTGEADVLEAIEAVRERYNIDPDRILLRGFSMGGCGAWHLALHMPDRWAAAEIGAGTWPRRYLMDGFPPHQAGPIRIYDNIPEWSLNVFNLPLAGHGGENERGVSSLPPPPPGTPTRGQLESSIRVREQLEREGFPSEGDPYELRAKGLDAFFFISKNTGHSTSPEVRAKLDAFLKTYGDRGRITPDHLRFVTYTTRYNRHYWVTLDRLEHLYERAEINARRLNGGRQYNVETRNLQRFTLVGVEAAESLTIDGQQIRVQSAREHSLEKIGGRWTPVRSAPAPGLWKTHGLQGPIDDAFLDPFLLVRPTGKPWHAVAHQQAMRMLARFDRLYARHLRAHPRIKRDRDVTADDVRRYNLILFGDPGSNAWIARVLPRLPIAWSQRALRVGGQTFSPADHLPALVYPHPLNPGRYVVLNTGFTFDDPDYGGEYPLPRLGDYAVLRAQEGAEWPEVVLAGLFDERWRFPRLRARDAATSRSAVRLERK